MPLSAAAVEHIGVASKLSKNMRTLHWVTKIGSLRNSLRFYELVLGMRVLRHEEFESGCEATCNGPYGGAWSKTMVGLGPEESNFVFELTYNYGIDSYENGNDVQHFTLAMPEAVTRAVALGYKVEYLEGEPLIHGPDHFRYKIVDPEAGRAERFAAVALRSSDLSLTRNYWCEVLGMSTFHSDETKLTVGWAADQVLLEFVNVGDGLAVEHGKAAGRIANACRAVEPFYEAAKASGLGDIMNTPITLPTPGKADVVVTILADPDGYEICFVGDVGFYDLATPLYDRVDWKLRASRGADGAPPPAAPRKLPPRKGMATVSDRAALNSLGSGAVVLDFGAGWCKNCMRLHPLVAQLSEQLRSGVTFASVDIDDAEELVEEFGVSSVPHFVVLKGGRKVSQYVGSNEAELEAFLTEALA